MNELIEIAERGKLTVAKTSKKTYFTVKTRAGETLICFNPSLYDECPPSAGIMVFVDRDSKMDTPPFDKAKDEEQTPKPASAQPPRPTQEIAPQEIGMWWKEVGKLIVASKLEEVFGEKDAPFLRKAYKLQAIASLGITAK